MSPFQKRLQIMKFYKNSVLSGFKIAVASNHLADSVDFEFLTGQY